MADFDSSIEKREADECSRGDNLTLRDAL